MAQVASDGHPKIMISLQGHPVLVKKELYKVHATALSLSWYLVQWIYSTATKTHLNLQISE